MIFKVFRALLTTLTFVTTAILFISCAPPEAEMAGDTGDLTIVPDVAERLAQFAPTEVGADVATLSESERQVLDKLIEAAKNMDRAFLLQAWPENASFRERLSQQEGDHVESALAYFDVMYGPWDRLAHREPFVGSHPHPPGAGFYPEDLTKEELEAYIEAHPDQKESLMSWYTVIRREGDQLVARPYSEVYRDELEPAAQRLREAAELTDNSSLKDFLTKRAASFLSDDYYESEIAWMDLDSRIEVTIGPYEVYEDELMAQKTAFEAFVTVSDPEASAALDKFKSLLPDMEMNLPIPDELKTVRGTESPIAVVDLVFAGGDTRSGVQTIAYNLPNDEKIRSSKGSKKVMLRNVMKAKFESILVPVAGEVMNASQLPLLSAEAFFQETVFHELSHALGPGFVTGTDKEVREALQEIYSALEEAKADVMGAYNILYMIDREQFPAEFRNEFLATYFAGLFRSIRFGTAEAHGKGAALQLNYFLTKETATLGDDGKFTVDLPALEKAITELVREICLIQAAGDKDKGVKLLEMGKVTPDIQQALDRLSSVPVDIRPFYVGAAETMP
jgi:hypothetical protein